MRIPSSILAVNALIAALTSAQAAPLLFANGDFETAAGASWSEVSGGGTFSFSYPSDQGNPGGFGVIDHTADDGGFGIWVANGNAEISLASLGLIAGETYVFTQDMKILSGSTIGGFKVDFFAGGEFSGSTNNIYPAPIGDGLSWATYSFRVTIPSGTEGIKVVPLWSEGSSIGYDNIGVDTTPVPTPKLPNGDFENGNASWFEVGAPNTTYSYPGSGGNPGGHGIMTNDGSGFGIWVANGGAPLALDSLGLSGGDTVTFSQDMTIVSGSNIGGLKIEFLAGETFLGDTGNMYPDLIGTGSTWETYSFDVTILEAADRIKVVPLWGPGSTIGFDNVTFSPASVTPSALEFTIGTAVSWTPASATNLYQPQKSVDGTDWVNLGMALEGDAVTTAFDPDASPFYRVLETTVAVSDAVQNGGFETADFSDPELADRWTSIGSQGPTRITTDKRNGEAAMQILVENDATPSANYSELQQEVAMAGGVITAGETYDLSFWAKQIANGVSYVQNYRLQWLDGGGAIVAEAFGFTPFLGGNEEWVEIAVPDLEAPAGASTALIQISGATGAVAGASARGGVLIDDISLVGASTSQPVIESVLNGNFEFPDFENFLCAESWTCGGTQSSENVLYDSRSGASMELKVENDASAMPNSSAIQQDIFAAGGAIIPGVTYDFSFWAKQLSSGVSYVQQYRLEWRDAFDAPLPGGIAFTAFVGGNGEWIETAVPGLEAPAGAQTAFIEIVASTGAVAGAAAEGGVLIDDVSLAEAVLPDVLDATPGPGLEISWPTEAGKDYQLESSSTLESFENFGPSIRGDGTRASLTDLLTLPANYYRVVETTP